MTKVVHLTTIHAVFDNRIFVRECRSLARVGYEVVLVAPQGLGAGDTVVDGVRIRPVPQARGRADRLLLRQGFRVFRRALAERANLYHFHDPDLLPWGLLLRLATGRPVVYDVHEDYVTAFADKPYLPRRVGRLFGLAYGALERLTRAAFAVVIAERYYARRFPDGVPVLNYPDQGVLDELLAQPRVAPTDGSVRLLYTGTAAAARGAFVMAELAARLPEGGSVTMIGACPPDVARAARALCPDPRRLRIISGEGGGHVPHGRIVAAHREPWTAALALFPDTPHVREKELTKFFEYMAAGLPIVCSDFPVWRDLVERTGAGVCVPPGDAGTALAAAAGLAADAGRAAAMGEAGRRAARSRFSWDGQARRLAELYARLAPPPAAGAALPLQGGR